MDGQGVQQFVGKDAAGPGGRQPEDVANDAAGVGKTPLPPGGGAQVAEDILRGVAKPVGQKAGGSQDVAAQQPVAGPRLQDGERARAFQQRPEVKQLHRQQRAESGMHLRRGVIVGQRVGAGAGVIAARPVEGDGHIVRKSNGAVTGDAAANGAFRRGGYGAGANRHRSLHSWHSFAGLPGQALGKAGGRAAQPDSKGSSRRRVRAGQGKGRYIQGCL